MPALHEWLSEYGESHRNETNKLIHWICVPAIFFSIIGMLYGIKLPVHLQAHRLNIAMIVTALVVGYYAVLSPALAVGMLLFSSLCLFVAHLVEQSGIIPLWFFSLIVFALS